MKHLLFVIILFFAIPVLFAQEATPPVEEDFHVEEVDDTTKRDKYIHFFNDNDLLEWEPEEEPKEFKKKKKKRKVYYGIKTKKGFTKKGSGKKMEVEVFYYLKVYQDPNPYVKDVYWYNIRKRKIEKSRPDKVDPAEAKILHGPYKRIVNGEVMAKGVYYVGTKHARWEEWKAPKAHKYKDSIEVEEKQLVLKEKYNRGFPKDSEISFFDSDKTQLKEIIPIVNGEKHGYYFKFYENGMMEEQGKYEHDEKVGNWYEYYKGVKRNFKKRITVYPDSRSDEKFEPYISHEYDETGHETYNKEEEEKQRLLEEKKKNEFKF